MSGLSIRVMRQEEASYLPPGHRESAVIYPGNIRYISAVRAQLKPLLRGCPRADDVILCTSELAANAALHSYSSRPGGVFTVRAEVSPGDYIRVEVRDNGGPWTVITPLQGHGLDIVRTLATSWGIDSANRGRCIWARFAWSTKTHTPSQGITRIGAEDYPQRTRLTSNTR
jgi:anti-sigma regulatory factor (Ser/Thr protein kinase)